MPRGKNHEMDGHMQRRGDRAAESANGAHPQHTPQEVTASHREDRKANGRTPSAGEQLAVGGTWNIGENLRRLFGSSTH